MKTIALLLLFLFCSTPAWAEKTIRIGLAIPLTGEVPKVGESSRQAAQLRFEEINSQGGLLVGGQRYPLEFIYEDTEARPESAVNVVFKLITMDRVLAIVGPQGSRQALPAGGVADKAGVPLVAPWPTNPELTKNRPYVFRIAFVDDFQARALAAFAQDELKAESAAVLFDLSNDYSKGLADLFRTEWANRHGKEAVLAFESYGGRDQDFSAQLTKIIAAKPDLLVLPAYYNFAALIVRQARELGYQGQILGSDAWASPELAILCGPACRGLYFSSHYSPNQASGRAGDFVARYTERFGQIPDDVAALTIDAVDIVLAAIQQSGSLDQDLKTMRTKIRDHIASILFAGVTGHINFDRQGDPVKCALMMQVGDDDQFQFYKTFCPDSL